MEACFRADEQVGPNPPPQKAYRTLPVFWDGKQMVGRMQRQLEKAVQLSIDGVLVLTLTQRFLGRQGAVIFLASAGKKKLQKQNAHV